MTSEQRDHRDLLQRILSKLEVVRDPDDRGEYTAWCPFHPDGSGKPPHNPNLRVSERGFICHACGQKGGLRKLAEHLGINAEARRPDPEKVYSYTDKQAKLLFQVVRRPGKRFVQRRPDRNGGWIYDLKGVRRVLYRLPEIIARPEETVHAVEGEKDADRLAELGLLATTNPCGAGKWRPEYSEALRDRGVVILPDNDDPGRGHAETVAQALSGAARSVKVLELPGLPEKGDVSDWVDAGGTVEELRRLVDAAPEWETHGEEPETTEIMDDSPECISRPLCLVGGHAYAATWLWMRRTIRRTTDKKGNVEIHDPPIERDDQVLVVIRDDGQVFTDAALKGARPRSELGMNVHLPEIPPAHRLWSGAGVKRFMACALPDAADVFRRSVDIVGRFIDFSRSLADQETMCDLVGCYILATYLLDGFNVIGYLWPNGDRGTGKTHFLHTVAEVACLGQVILAGGTYATLRDMADYGATLAFDDAEGIMDAKRADPDKRSLLLAGNRRGTTIAFKEPAGARAWTTRHVHTFCPRLFSAIRLPDEVLASRTITIPLVRSGDPRRSNADPLDYAAWPHDHARLKDDLWAVGLTGLPMIGQFDKDAAARARLSGRDLQPWRAVLAVALWLEESFGLKGLFERMEALSVAYQKERCELECSDPTRLAILGLWELCEEEGQEVIHFRTAELTNRMNVLAVRLEVTSEGDSFTSTKRLGWLLKRLRLDKSDSREARGWKTTRAEVRALGSSYGMALGQDENVKNAQDVENAADVSTFSTSATFGEGVELEETEQPPRRACSVCRETRWWWQKSSKSWVCGVCHPDPRVLASGYTSGAVDER